MSSQVEDVDSNGGTSIFVEVPPPVSAAGDTDTFEDDTPKGLESYDDRYVAFVDILGFKEMIRASSERPEEVGQLAAALDVSFAPNVYSIVLEELAVTDAEVDVRIHTFSDFVVASTKPTAAGLSVLVYIIWVLSTNWLSSKILCRGGITRGKVLHRTSTDSTKRQMVFGPAFIEAYTLESSIADYPRVILSKKVRDEWDTYKAAGSLGSQIPLLVHKCSDGPNCVDIFCHLKQRGFSLVTEDSQQEAGHMQSSLQGHLNETAETPEIHRKTKWLSEKFNAAVSDTRHAHLKIEL